MNIEYDYSRRFVDNGYYHTIILTDTGKVKTAGSNNFGRLGIIDSNPPSSNNYYSFQDVVIPNQGAANVVAVAAGIDHSLVLLSSGKVLGFGVGYYGSIGTDTGTQSVETPTPITTKNGTQNIYSGLDNYTGSNGQFSAYDEQNAKYIAAGARASALITTTGTLLLWGGCENGQFGLGETDTDRVTNKKIFFPIEPNRTGGYDGTNAKQVAIGYSHILLLLTNGKVLSAGDKNDNRLGFPSDQANTTNFQSVFKEIDSSIVTGYNGSNVIQVACGTSHSAVLLKSGAVVCFGNNDKGQVNNSITFGAKYIECGPRRTFVLMDTGLIRCFGYNGPNSVLGINNVTTEKITNVLEVHKDINNIYDQTNAIFISSNSNHNIIVTKQFKILGFGLNDDGRLGFNSTNNDPANVEKIPKLIENESVMLTEIFEKYITIYAKDGNVGIGTDNTQSKLHVNVNLDNNAISIGPGTTGNGTFNIMEKSAGLANHTLVFSTSGYNTSTYNKDNILTLNTSGHVGIGTDNIKSKLHVNLDLDQDAISIGPGTTGNGTFNIMEKSAGLANHTLVFSTSGYNTGTYNKDDILSLNTAGNVGIGISNPSYPLEVKAVSGPNVNIEASTINQLWFVRGGGGEEGYTNNLYYNLQPERTNTYHGANISIVSTGGIWSKFALFASSDTRIKQNITDVSDASALQKLRNINCYYYEYIDKLKKGWGQTIGFIAQQVKEHFPIAVSFQKSIIPNEIRVIETPQWTEINDGSNNKLKLTISDLDDISGNTKYKFYVSNDLSGNNEYEKEIYSLEDEPNSFIFDQSWNNVFLYGKEVDDFHTLDKQKLFALNFSATQEIDRIQQTQVVDISLNKLEINEAKQKIQLLETQNSNLLTRLEALEKKINELS